MGEPLAVIAQRHSTGQMGWGDKTGYHDYIPTYEAHLPADVHFLLEIGVSHGHSMTMWAEAFPTADVLGMDVCLLQEAFDRCDGYSNIVLLLEDATRRSPKTTEISRISFDVIIDDGSHKLADQLAALILWWPALRAGGRYFIEDIQGDGALSILQDYLHSERIDYHLYDGRGPGKPFDELMLVLTK